MTAVHVLPSTSVIRLPVRPRPRVVAEAPGEAVPASGIRGEIRPFASALGVVPGQKRPGGLALDHLLENGTLDVHHYATAQA